MSTDIKKASHLMTEGNIIKQIMLFALPVMATNILNSCYSIADTLIVGHWTGDNALASVGLVESITALMFSLFLGMSIGASVIVSRYFGSRENEKLEEAVHSSYALSILLGIILTIIGLIISPFVLRWMGADPIADKEIYDGSLLYLQIIFLGTVPNLIYNFCAGILRAVGDSRHPLIYLVVSCFTNIVLNLLFVAGFDMGVKGVAIATVISQLLSAVLATLTLVRTKDVYKLNLKHIRLVKEDVVSILKVGLPSGIQSSLFSVSNIIIISEVKALGSICVTGNSAASAITGPLFQISNAFNVAMTTFAAQNHGAKQYKRIMSGVWKCLICASLVVFAVGAVMAIFSEPLSRLFTSTPRAISVSVSRTLILGLTTFTYAMFDVFCSAIRGCGSALPPMLISIFGICIVRILWIWIMLPIFNEVETIFWAFPVSYIVSLGLILFYFFKYKKSWLYNH